MHLRRFLISLVLGCCCSHLPVGAADAGDFIRVSPRDPRYFETGDGRPWIPIGLNLIAPNTTDAQGLARMDEWLGKLAANGGNFARVWLSSPFWDVEHERSGVYDEAKAARIDALLAMARRHGVRLKLTLEHFREMSDNPRQRWANKPMHLAVNGGPATTMADFFSGEASRAQFRGKLAWFANRYGSDPTIFAWELWNEVNAVRAGSEDFMPWTGTMLAELHRLFPRNLALQSLGSFDHDRVRDLSRRQSLLPGNDAAQVHRYLDLGAALEVCHGPVDMLAADAVREILSCGAGKPVLLAESGAVEPGHSGPFKLYARDRAGIILHDVLFAPFFAGAAGTGQIWHWDAYVDPNNLWHHFARFAAAVKNIDPPAEGFEPRMIQHPRLRAYALKGRSTLLIWCRDSENTWQTELAEGRAPQRITGAKLDLSEVLEGQTVGTARSYDPWADHWEAGRLVAGVLRLPEFSRSIVVRIDCE